MEEENGMAKENRYELNKELAQMLKGGRHARHLRPR